MRWRQPRDNPLRGAFPVSVTPPGGSPCSRPTPAPKSVHQLARMTTVVQLSPETARVCSRSWKTSIEPAGTPVPRRRCSSTSVPRRRPNVAATGLSGPAADQAEATAWEATWEAMTLPSLRSARSPWGVLWATARRAANGRAGAGMYCTDVRAAWRAARPDAADNVASDQAADTRGAFRHDPPVSLTDLEGRGMGLPASPTSTGTESSDLLPIVVRALVEAGWMERPAAEIVDAVSGGSADDSRTRSGARGGLQLAEVLDVPPWHVRGSTVVMLGLQDCGLSRR